MTSASGWETERVTWILLLVATAALSAGCIAVPGSQSFEGDEAITADDVALVSLNGLKMNGLKMNGLKMNGVSLTGVTLDGTVLSGRDADGELLTGADLSAVTMVATLEDGSEVTLRIDAIEPTADPEITVYALSYWTGADWASACGYAEAIPIRAIATSGSWDYSESTPTGGDHTESTSQLTFACRNGAIGKCVEMGYKPWKSVTECNKGACLHRPLRPFHQTCTRMLRADICGDGAPHTRAGTPVNVWDRFNVQVRQKKGGGWDWEGEGEWGTEGAICLHEVRYAANDATARYIDDHCPDHWKAGFKCLGNKSTFFTRHGFSTPMNARSLIRNEFATNSADD